MAKPSQTLNKVFIDAVKFVNSTFKTKDIVFSNIEKLHFYALYKIATKADDFEFEIPNVDQVVERAKYEAYMSFKGRIQPEEAKDMYV